MKDRETSTDNLLKEMEIKSLVVYSFGDAEEFSFFDGFDFLSCYCKIPKHLNDESQFDLDNENPTVVFISKDKLDLLKENSDLFFIPQIYWVCVGQLPEKNLEVVNTFLKSPINDIELEQTLLAASKYLLLSYQNKIVKESLVQKKKEISVLHKIGKALSAEKDLNHLLELIVNKSCEITNSDAGSLFLLDDRGKLEERLPNGDLPGKCLRFKIARNDSINFEFKELALPVSTKSIVGYVTVTGEIVNESDVYDLADKCEYSFNQEIDLKIGYRTKSIIAVPLKNHKNEIIGVLQLLNRKRKSNIKLTPNSTVKNVIPYDDNMESLVHSLGSQAAVAIENTKLYDDIHKLFDGFIHASVKAIEQRDPATSGHSKRVADLVVEVAHKMDADSGHFKEVHFSRDEVEELKYAAILHDFGKIGVREDVLVKAKKLFPQQLSEIEHRFQYFKEVLIKKGEEEKVKHLIDLGAQNPHEIVDRINSMTNKDLKNLDEIFELIKNSNEPTILPEEASGRLKEIADLSFLITPEKNTPYLSGCELEALSVVKGSLTENERKEIESHVVHTYNFLTQIPWTKEFMSIPKIAGAHHEKLDGSGYPHNLKEVEIPIQSKIMTVADIFDALTASDRPYKKAMPVNRALQILGFESKDGKIDNNILDLFIEAKCYSVLGMD